MTDAVSRSKLLFFASKSDTGMKETNLLDQKMSIVF